MAPTVNYNNYVFVILPRLLLDWKSQTSRHLNEILLGLRRWLTDNTQLRT